MASLAIDHRHHCWNPTLYTYFIAIPRITEKQSTIFSLVFTSVFHWLLTFLQKATIRFKENSLNLNFFRLMIKFCTWQIVTFWALRHGHLKTLGGDIITRHRGTGSMSQDKSFTKFCIWTSPGLKKNAVTCSSHRKNLMHI